ncbi:MAG: flagellar biosynthetic protein FliR [Planctomycetes bacterium]|nr:flagellar biosynthetic protein FliR [Planctomycetota bacterium]
MGFDFLEENVRFIALHCVRCLAMIGPLPIFGQGRDSRLARVGLGVILGTLIGLTSDASGFVDPGVSIMLGLMAAKEMLLGLVMSYVALLAFSTLRISGHVIGEEMGFNMASIQDPITGVNSQLMAHFFDALGMMVFFIGGGHHVLIRALSRSFGAHPVGTFSIDGELLSALVVYSGGIFAAALRVAGPVFAALMVLAVALAILAKVAPQLQIMMFAFPLKILAGLILLLATLGVILPTMNVVFDDMEVFMFEAFERFA